eukprot:9771824-Prorocentrum_lima.AAC.1
MGLQETQQQYNTRESIQGYMFFYSSTPRKFAHGRFTTGVALVINNEWYSALEDIEPVNDRILRASFRGAVLITVIVVYAPTASRMDIEKEAFYDDLGGAYEKWQSK